MFPVTVNLRSNPVMISILLINLAVYLVAQFFSLPSKSFCFGGLSLFGVVVEKEYWRLASSIFMHYSFSHLVFNSVALLIFGSYAERFWGKWRFILIYLAAGVVANLIALAFAYWTNIISYCAIGASASILGIMSASAYLMWQLWRKNRNPVALVFARQLAIIFVLQFVIDIFVPQTSSLHHIVGAVAGLLMARLLLASGFRAAR